MVIGGICRETKDVFLALCPENKRDVAMLMEIIDRHTSTEIPQLSRTVGVLTISWMQTVVRTPL